MKINEKLFSLPPYISTSWTHVAALHMKESTLLVSLLEGEVIEIPSLKADLLELIFNAHAKYIENNSFDQLTSTQNIDVLSFQQQEGEEGFRFGLGGLENIGTALQHNPSQSGGPDLPKEVLDKVRSIAKVIAPDDPMAIPKPEPHCNCMHCQIARAVNQGLGMNDIYEKREVEEVLEETVPDEELQFQQWEILETGERMYQVSNRLNHEEKYNVFLGHPVGCTCGREGCEHILAVLKS